jgi:hypothetical protein
LKLDEIGSKRIKVVQNGHGLDRHGLDMVFTNIACSLGLTFNLVLIKIDLGTVYISKEKLILAI